MFKRANKITALVLAAASVMSVVPAMAASDRLGTKDGTIEHAVAYSDGKYVYQGYRTDDDDLAIYYNDGSKDKALDDVEDADLISPYEEKYAFAEDGGDQYLIDLSNGKIDDEDVPEDRYDNAKTKLKSKLAKTDRYSNVDDSDQITLSNGFSTKFGETWYSYEVSSSEGNAASTGKLYGFTNQNGKYIDVSNIANIYAYSTEEGKYVKMEEFDDTDKDKGLTVSLAAAPVVLATDKDYIYAKIEVNVFDSSPDVVITGTTTAAAAVMESDDAKVVAGADGMAANVTHRTYIQKISKEQGDQKDDAYLPKTVSTYELTKNELDCGDADDAFDAIAEADGFSAVDGKLLAIRANSDNVKVTSINLKKDKVKFEDKVPGNFDDPDDKVDVYLAEKDDDDDVDVDNGAKSYDVDVDGNVWVIADGKVYKFEKNEFAKKYTADTSLDSISVYDEKSLIVWEDDGDIYTTVNEGTAETQSEATPAVTTPATVGWSQLTDGTWNFYDATGAKVSSKWVNVGGVWYYLKADGVMATGWLNDNGTWYYLAGSGAMATGWLNDNGTWYYLAGSGAMLANTTVDGYVLGASGAWIR